MFLVVFESTVPPAAASASDKFYAKLLPILQTYSGFIKETSYVSSLDETSEVLVGYFEDEAAALRWRNDATHLRIQKAAREKIFSKYRVRVGNLVPTESLKAVPQPEQGAERLLVVLEQRKAGDAVRLSRADIGAAIGEEGISDFAAYASEDSFVSLVTMASYEAAAILASSEVVAQCASMSTIQVSRDYSGIDRSEAREP